MPCSAAARVPRPAQLRPGDLSLDPATRRVRRGEAEIELTAREFALLEYLMRRPGQVVAKSELLEHVWDAYDSLDLNVVEVYAGYLRRKIDVAVRAQRPADRPRSWLPAGRRRRLTRAAGPGSASR